MRIALIAPWLVKGGADRCGLDIVAALRASHPEAHIDIILTRENFQGNVWAAKFAQHGQVVDLAAHWHNCNSSQALLDFCRETRPDWVIINNSHEAYSAVRSIRKALPFAHLACLLHMDLPGAWDFPLAVQRAHQHFNTIFTVSDKLASSIVARGVPREKVIPLHWFGYQKLPECAPVKDVRKKLHIADPACRIILFPFRLAPQKRPELIIPIMGYLRKRMNCVAVIAGTGPCEGQVRSYAKAAWMKPIFLGSVDPDEMHHLYAAAYCCITPSSDEGIPLVYYEAQQVGCPVIASNVGAVSELVKNGTGILVPYETDSNEQAMKFAGAVLALDRSPEKRLSMIANARGNSARFTYEQWKHKLITTMSRPYEPAFQMGTAAHVPPSREKVFVIGAPKTGTSSVGRALEMLGYDDCRWSAVMQDYYHMSNLNPVWEHVGLHDSFSDGPFNTGDFYKVLFERFPTAKFIHTVRDKQLWKRSFEEHFSPDSDNPKVKDRYRLHAFVPEDWWEWYDRRNAEITHFFESHNSAHRLLRLNIGRDKPERMWMLLSQFLGAPPPENIAEFPHVNKDPKTETPTAP